jgi:hypothetical protein
VDEGFQGHSPLQEWEEAQSLKEWELKWAVFVNVCLTGLDVSGLLNFYAVVER